MLKLYEIWRKKDKDMRDNHYISAPASAGLKRLAVQPSGEK
jgi:hypothetical protein